MNSLILPKKNDPRLLVLLFLFSFAIYAMNFSGFSRTPAQLTVSFGTCLALDFLLNHLFNKKNLFPLSGIITSMGVLLLTDTEFLWVFALAAFISISSKHLLRFRDRHIFNPNTFGLVVLILGLPSYVHVFPPRWGGSVIWSLGLFALGLLIVFRVKRFYLSAGYALSFVGFSFLRTLFDNSSFLALLAPLWGPATQLFMFFMITDPRTTPQKRHEQIIFGVTIGVIDVVLRVLQVNVSIIYSLFITCILYNLCKWWLDLKASESPWVTKEVHFKA